MLNEQQREYIRKLSGKSYDFDNLSDDEYVEIEDTVADRLEYAGLDADYEPNEEGLMCESILDSLDLTADEVEDARLNPLKIESVKANERGLAVQRYIGEYATLEVDSETGDITAMWKTDKMLIKGLKQW